MGVGLLLIGFSAWQGLLGRLEWQAAEAVLDELDVWISRADVAFRGITRPPPGDGKEASDDRDRATVIYQEFHESCAHYIETQFGEEERASFDAATRKNIYGDRHGRMGEYEGSILVLERWLERCRARVATGRLVTLEGTRMRD